MGGKIVLLGGIISRYLLIGSELKKNDNTNAPPLHLGEVIPAELIKNLLTSQQSIALKEKILNDS